MVVSDLKLINCEHSLNRNLMIIFKKTDKSKMSEFEFQMKGLHILRFSWDFKIFFIDCYQNSSLEISPKCASNQNQILSGILSGIIPRVSSLIHFRIPSQEPFMEYSRKSNRDSSRILPRFSLEIPVWYFFPDFFRGSFQCSFWNSS